MNKVVNGRTSAIQTPLFEPIEPRVVGTKEAHAVIWQRDSSATFTTEQTLFGPVEAQPQARRRALRMKELLGAIEEGPEEVKSCNCHVEMLGYFIARSETLRLDPNDHDGLLRLIGATEDLLTEEDCQQMRSNRQIWTPYPTGWIGTVEGDMYPVALHPKEVEYLLLLQAEIREHISAVRAGLLACQAELGALQAIGPLPDDIAQRYGLTREGTRSKTPVPKTL